RNQENNFEKGQVVGAYLGGRSVQDISEMCNVSRCTVSEILDTYKLHLELMPRLKRKSGGATAMKTRKRNEAQNGQSREKRLLNEEMDEETETKKNLE
uniref:Uncharacterized protein n=1 Tax=Periophthalmus magnuspinnatus TaxID=409849 RepID=A0A3B4AHK9_9GOBI